jgi:uncharacterized caspase-like protein
MRLVILLFVALVVGASTAAAQGSRVALVVGAGAYRAVPTLPNPPSDARAIAAALRRLGFATDLVIDPDRAQLESAIRRLGESARAADAALFFYAGHALEANGRNNLVPVTARIETARDVPFETVDLDLVASGLDGRARTILVFLDACRDNPFALKLGDGGRGIATRGLAAPASTATGMLIAFATAPGQLAADGRGEHSPFTAALLHHIETPGLEVRQMLARVRKEVREATNGGQVPWESSALEGDFYFHPAAEPPVAATPAAPPANDRTPPSAAPRSAQPPATAPTAATVPVAPPATRQPPVATGLPAPIASRAAAVCDVSAFAGGIRGAGALASMHLSGGGGSCGTDVFLHPGTRIPFSRLVVTTRPVHGTVETGESVVTYRPEPGFTGQDRFIVSTIPAGSLEFTVTVDPPP